MALNKVMHKVVHNDVDNLNGEEVVKNENLFCALCRIKPKIDFQTYFEFNIQLKGCMYE